MPPPEPKRRHHLDKHQVEQRITRASLSARRCPRRRTQVVSPIVRSDFAGVMNRKHQAAVGAALSALSAAFLKSFATGGQA
jgi:hypothetical protein